MVLILTLSLIHILKGLRKLLLNEPAIYRDLDNCWSVVAEAIQTILRREAYPHPVSYTPLDVYKRQVYDVCSGRL